MAGFSVTIKSINAGTDGSALGHVWITLEKPDGTTQSWAHYPSGLQNSDDADHPVADFQRTWSITQDQYDEVTRYIDGYGVRPYLFPWQVCIDFATGALKAAGVPLANHDDGPLLPRDIEPWLDDPHFGRPAYPRPGFPSLWDLEGWNDAFQQAEATPPPPSPIILDLDGDGVETVGVNAGAYFDHDANGFAESTGWVGRDDGALALDRDGDGRITSGRELFGNETLLADGTKAANGFQALAELDGNGDGRIDSTDAAWASLKLWRDLDGDGYSAADELIGLSEAGVQSIGTGSTASTYIDPNGNEHRQVGSFIRADGTTGTATDVWFKTDAMRALAEAWLAVPADIAALPDLQGLGNVYDLHQAMVRDAGGALQGLVQSFVQPTATLERNALFEQILFKWTGVESLDPASRGGNIDARQLAVLEAFMGQGFVGVGGVVNPNAAAAGAPRKPRPKRHSPCGRTPASRILPSRNTGSELSSG